MTGVDPITDRESALVFAADDNFTEGLAVAVHSALAHMSPSFSPDLYVIDNGLSDSSRARLARVVMSCRPGLELRTVRIDAHRLGPLPEGSRLTPATYSRLLVGEILPPHVRRAVYLDSDVLVRRDIAPLFTVDLRGSVIGAVRDYFTASTADSLSGLRDHPDPRPYFNSGVLVIDIPAWREGAVGERVLEYATAGPPLKWADQDALNGGIETWHELDYHWNVQQLPVSMLAREIGRAPSAREQYVYGQRWNLYRSAAVIHFIAATKPWQHTCVTVGSNAWVRSLIRSRWYSADEMLVWLARRYVPRLRYRLGTSRRRILRSTA